MHTQRLVTEIEMLKLALFLVNRNMLDDDNNNKQRIEGKRSSRF
jgi:hypothetical protein